MDRSIAQALTALIPSFSGPLPQELVELAVSLLAQSRNKASSLKAEEEIARSYACANLACERLKLSLGLPKIEPRPPCPPRVYQKLYKYLDNALTAGTRRSGRPARTHAAEEIPTSSPAKPRTPVKSTRSMHATPRKKVNSNVVIAEVPSWVLPIIRHLCKELVTPAAPHHVFAGVSSIMTLPAPRSSDERAANAESGTANIAALIIAVYLLVITRLSGSEMPASEFARLRGLAIASIRESNIKESKEEVADTEKVITLVRDWMRDIGAKGWTELDWFANVGEGTGLGVTQHEDSEEMEVDVDNDDDYENGRGRKSIIRHNDNNLDADDLNILRPGLGTMMQDRVDYLSESKVREYQAWKRDILRRCDEIENARKANEQAG